MVYFFIIAGIILRLIPHVPNFVPISAIALFSGVYLDKKFAIIIPIIIMFISDLYIGFANFWVVVSVYLSFIIIGILGIWLKKKKNIPNTFGITLTGSLIFFILTNFAVWAGTPWYSKNLSGLIQCYYLAIPFFRNTVLGDLFYVSVLFGLYELINYYVSRRLLWQKAK